MNSSESFERAGLFYSDVQSYRSWVGKAHADVISSDAPLAEDGDVEKIKEALLTAEAEVDSYLSVVYNVPVPRKYRRAINVLRMDVYKIATIHIVGRNGVTKEFFFQYEQTVDRLREITKGEKPLVGVPISNSVKPVHGSYTPRPDKENWAAI